MFGLVNFRINRVLQNTRRGGGGGSDEQALDETGDILQMMKQLPGCEQADDVDIRQWILADDRDVGHQMYTDNDIVSLVLSEKSCQDDSNESDSDQLQWE
jgi:hypothetical protein